MNEGAFKNSVRESIALLKSFNLFKRKGSKEIGDHSTEFKKVSRKNRHLDIYNAAIEKEDYEILLKDDSIFQFSLNAGVLRYAFIQNPQIFVTKESYLNIIYTPEELLQMTPEEQDECLSSINEDEYEQFLDEQNLNLDAQVIRYDLDKKGYYPLLHSYSHIHIGLSENLRIPCAKALTPLKFVIFSIKNTYYDHWKAILVADGNMSEKIRNSKSQCVDLSNTEFTIVEKGELHLA